MMIFLRAVTAHGTGMAASQLNHPLGGKTGTTSDYTDAWFLGFSPSVTCGVWVGYDSRESLGDKETGAKAALPIWMNVMKVAIAGKDDERFLGDDQPTPQLEKASAPPAPTTPAVPARPTGPKLSSPNPTDPKKIAAASSNPKPPQPKSPQPKSPQ
jgi:penicillin-binding protein 1A